MESTKKSNKIREIVRLQQILKKWKKIAAASKSNNTTCPPEAAPAASATASKTKTISPTKFLKKTLSFSSSSSAADVNINSGGGSSAMSDQDVVPKGYLAVCVGREEEMKRFVIPTDYLGHQAFGILLREAEEEFGFQQEGILKIPCEVPVFQNILKMMQHHASGSASSGKRSSSSASSFFLHDHDHHKEEDMDMDMDMDMMTKKNMVSSSCSYSPPHSERSSAPPHSSPHLQLCR